MCFGGGAKTSSGPAYTTVTYTNPDTGASSDYVVEDGVPADYAARGATTVIDYQTMAAQDLSDKQIAADKAIADDQAAFNQKQYDETVKEYNDQQKQVDEQAQRQSDYDTGRSTLLSDATKKIDDAFGTFTDDYYKTYAKDYVAKAQDNIDYQKLQAQKDLAFGLARQGITSSQAGVNEAGKITELAGRSTDAATADAAAAEASLKSKVAAAKTDLLTGVTNAEAIGSPIAGSTTESVNSALDTQKSAITGVTSTAGDVTSSLSAQPTVSTLSDIFSGVLGAGTSLVGGITSGTRIGTGYSAGLAGTSPSASSTK